MKKKQIYALLTATVLMATSITGCSGKTTEETAVEETAETEEAPEEEAVEEPVYETRQYTVEVATANEDGTFTAYDTDGKQYILTLATELSDDEKALVVPEACLIVSTEVQVGTKLVVNGEEVSTTGEDAEENADAEVATEENTEESTDSADENLATEEGSEENADAEVATEETAEESEGEEVATEEPITITVTAVEALDDEVQAATLATVTFKAINGFSVEDLGDTTMYAKQSVNVRKGPSSDYEQLGSLSSGQEVTVTGIADSGWYRIKYNDEDGYCSNNYLQTEKPAPKAAASSNSGSASSAGTQVAQADTGASAPAASSGVDQSALMAQYKEAVNAGDWDRAKQIMEQSVGAPIGGGGSSSSGSSSSGGSGSSSSSSERSVSTSADFVNYLNQKRAEAGLGELSWSDSMASTATERASEIVDNFSHSGMRNCSSEIILQSNSGDVSSWFNQFYNSPGHKAAMMGGCETAAAAYCKVGNKYYVIAMFDFN